MWSVQALFVVVILNISCCVQSFFLSSPQLSSVTAVALISNPLSPQGPVIGTIRFSQAGPGAPVVVDGQVQGLPANSQHGIHVHEFGSINGQDGCDGAGEHFNPFLQNHGSQYSPVRHEGDLGNVIANTYGVARIHKITSGMTMFGPRAMNILGRAIVLHSSQDDLGQGFNTESLMNGNSGSRIGCGVIFLGQY